MSDRRMSGPPAPSNSSTLHDSPSPTPPQESKYPPETEKPASSYTSKRTLWRPYVTKFDDILNHHYSGSGTDEDPYIVDWLPADREDPQLWPSVYKWTCIGVVSWATLAVALSSSAYSGGIESLIKEEHASAELLTSGISLFVVGFAFGPLLWAPMSEVYGRRRVFIISYALLTLWQGVTAAAQTVPQILVFRFLAGFFGSSPLANAGGTISDVLNANQRGLGMALFAAAPFLGPSLGPITGGFLGLAAGWRWVEGFLAIFTGVLTLILILFSSETYAPYLLRTRANKLAKLTGKVYRYRPDAKKAFSPNQLFKGALLRPWKFLIFEPIVLILTIYTALVYGILYLNFAAFPIVFQELRGWNTGVGGLAFLGITGGTALSVVLSIWYINPQYIKTAKKKGGRADPEDRLPPAIWGGVLIVIGIAGFAATNGPNIHWIAPILFGVPFGLGVIVMFLAVLGYLVDSYTIYAASVLAANSVLRSLFGAAFPLFTSYMKVALLSLRCARLTPDRRYDTLGIHWAAALPGFIALACIPFTVLFYKYGASIRAKCKYAADAERQMAAIMAARMGQVKKDEEANPQGPGAGGPGAGAGPAVKDKEAEAEANGPTPVPDNTAQNGAPTSMSAGVGQMERVGSNPAPFIDPQTHHEWTMYEVLADRDRTDLSDDERVKLEHLHKKFNHAKAKGKGQGEQTGAAGGGLSRNASGRKPVSPSGASTPRNIEFIPAPGSTDPHVTSNQDSAARPPPSRPTSSPSHDMGALGAAIRTASGRWVKPEAQIDVPSQSTQAGGLSSVPEGQGVTGQTSGSVSGGQQQGEMDGVEGDAGVRNPQRSSTMGSIVLGPVAK